MKETLESKNTVEINPDPWAMEFDEWIVLVALKHGQVLRNQRPAIEVATLDFVRG